MSDESPFGPFVPLGRRGPMRALGLLVALAAGGTGVVLVLTGSGCGTERFAPGSGDGRSPDRPLLVADAAGLLELDACADRHFRQVTDLDAPNPWTPVGLGRPAGFSGSYDGAGHRLRGVRIFLPGSTDVGVFGLLSGEVRDLTLEDVVVEAADRTGAIAGRVLATGRVEGVTVRDGRIVGAGDIGGLVGLADPAATVEGTFEGDVSGPDGSIGSTAIGRRGQPTTATTAD